MLENLSYSIRRECALCQSKVLRVVLRYKPTPLANSFYDSVKIAKEQGNQKIPLSLLKCEGCGHVQIRELVNEKELFSTYPYKSSTSLTMRNRLKDLSVYYFDRYPNGSSVLEIGSNDNYLLNFFAQRGWKCVAVDPAFDANVDIKSPNIRQINEFFSEELVDEIRSQIGYPDLIIANNVLAHNRDLEKVFLGISELTSEATHVYLEVSYVGSILEKTLIDTVYHEHFSYHSVKSLAKFVRKFNLEIFLLEEFDAHGGSIRVGLRRGNGSGELEAMTYYINKEEELDSWENWETLQSYVDSLGAEIVSNVMRSYDETPIYGYGVSAKFSTLYHGVGLGEIPFNGFVDDNPLKMMKIAPGTNELIRNPNTLNDLSKFDIFVFAWNYAESILDGFKSRKPRRAWIPLPMLTQRNLLCEEN